MIWNSVEHRQLDQNSFCFFPNLHHKPGEYDDPNIFNFFDDERDENSSNISSRSNKTMTELLTFDVCCVMIKESSALIS